LKLVKLNLLVLRVAELAKARRYYERLGMLFTEEQHGKGPLHLSANLEGTVFELYLKTESESSTSGTRFGLAVDDVQRAVRDAEASGGTVLVAPRVSHWGIRAVVVDLDGHKIEITERAAAE
jgi:lactoylglutathione lyase